MSKTRINFALGLLFIVIVGGCSEREQLAKRLAEEKTVSDAKAPPAISEFHDAALNGVTDFVRNALERRIDVNAIDEEGRSALQLASFNGHHDANTLIMIDAEKLFGSPLADRERWDARRKAAFEAGVSALPPGASAVLLAGERRHPAGRTRVRSRQRSIDMEKHRRSDRNDPT